MAAFEVFTEVAATGTGAVSRLTDSSNPTPQGFSPDGRVLTYNDFDDIYVLRLDSDGTPEPLVATPAQESGGYISPNGRWIAYSSDESGRSEVYVRPFPDVEEGRWQVSMNGGTEAAWAIDGRELFYRDGDQMMGTEIGEGQRLGTNRRACCSKAATTRTVSATTMLPEMADFSWSRTSHRLIRRRRASILFWCRTGSRS